MVGGGQEERREGERRELWGVEGNRLWGPHLLSIPYKNLFSPRTLQE